MAHGHHEGIDPMFEVIERNLINKLLGLYSSEIIIGKQHFNN